MGISVRQRLIRTFSHMKERCYDKNDKRYSDWGARGITICDEWLNDPEAFVSWAIGNGYIPGLCIDRIDNDSWYSPNNCRWVTLAENNQNRRSSRFYTINGETKNFQQWCDFYGVSRSMVDRRLSLGWDVEKAFTAPKKERNRNALVGQKFGRLTVIKYAGVSKHRQTLYECVCDCGNIVVTDGNKLSTGHNQSCGCLKAEMMENNRGDFKMGLAEAKK